MNIIISAETVSHIFASLFGCWALGYGVGNAVAWVRKIKDVV